jgi:cysteine desulfurase
MVYLDWAAASPPDTALLSESVRVLESKYGNPSSLHALGREAREELETVRTRLISLIGRERRNHGNLIFTSGGTEADALPILAVLRSALSARRGGGVKELRILLSGIEHAAVFEQAQLLASLGLSIDIVNPAADGIIDPAKVAEAVRKDTVLAAIMAVNNETGAVQNLSAVSRALAEAADALHRRPPRLHVDAVQAFGKIPFSPAGLGLSSAAFSAHKIQGPRGIGALWYSEEFESLLAGGGQEGGVRPGTENLQAAWAFAAAAETAVSALDRSLAHARLLEARLFEGLAAIPGAQPLPLGRRAGDERYSPYILSIAFPGLAGEVMVRALSDAGIAVSTGAACSSNTKRSGRRVLEAMGLDPELAMSAIRVSTGRLTSDSDIDLFLETAADTYAKLRT